jgi:hypothetical protein
MHTSMIVSTQCVWIYEFNYIQRTPAVQGNIQSDFQYTSCTRTNNSQVETIKYLINKSRSILVVIKIKHSTY